MNVVKILVVTLLFAAFATAQIPGLCNTGETPRNALGCSGILVPPNPPGGGPNRDGNWGLAFPYPSDLSLLGACGLTEFTKAWVDSPYSVPPAWLPNSASGASEWITPYDGEGNQPMGWFVYLTPFHVPKVLPGGIVPTGFTIRGRIASDDQTYYFVLSSPSNGACSRVEGVPVPVASSYEEWTEFSFTSPIPITPNSDVFLYALVYNDYDAHSPNPTGLRVEFFDTSGFY